MPNADAISFSKRHVSLPFATVIAAAGSIFGAGGTYAVIRGDIASGHAFTQRVESVSLERDQRLERRVEKLEDVHLKTLDFMARIDERLSAMQRDVADLKQRRP